MHLIKPTPFELYVKWLWNQSLRLRPVGSLAETECFETASDQKSSGLFASLIVKLFRV